MEYKYLKNNKFPHVLVHRYHKRKMTEFPPFLDFRRRNIKILKTIGERGDIWCITCGFEINGEKVVVLVD